MMKNQLLMLLAAAALGGAFLCPETLLSVVLGWIAAITIAKLAQEEEGRTKRFFVFGMFVTAIGFYWIPETVHYFGGFNYFIALCVFLVFCAVSGIQWLLFSLLIGWLPGSSLIRVPFAWFIAELLTPRMFPWALAHPQARLSWYSGLVELFGVEALSGFTMWVAVLVLLLFHRKLTGRTGVLSAVCIALLLFGSAYRSHQIESVLDITPSFNAALIQGNLDPKEKIDEARLALNLARYRGLSLQAEQAGADIVFWPETVMNSWTPEQLANVAGTRFDPAPGLGVPLLYGSLSFRVRSEASLQALQEQALTEFSPEYLRYLRHQRFNSALAVSPDGRVRGVYHKRILMPFGEFFPFARTFPALKDLSPQTGDFDVGDRLEPLPLAVAGNGESAADIKFAPLVCYEDLLPGPSLIAASYGAEVLVNITNDAWYGDTHAPYQHHLLAQWRAVEVRKYLLRVTNTGLTAVVDPFGRTVSELPLFQAEKLLAEVKPLNIRTLFSYWGRTPSYLLALLLLILSFVRLRRR